MSWAQIIAAIKMGLVASAESVANIISGVTVVGKATADGNGNNIVNTYAKKTEYLPLTGGTISGSNPALAINVTDTTYAMIPFRSKGTTMGYLGLASANDPAYADSVGVPYTLLHAGNYKTLITELNAKIAEERTVATIPNDYNAVFKIRGIKTNDVIGLTGTGITYSTVLGIRGWSDSSGGNSHEFALNGAGEVYHRHGATTEWSAWRKLLHTGNSVPVVVSTAAPSDTEAVWIVPS